VEESLDINVRKQSQVQVIRLRGDLKIGEPVDTFRQTMEELSGAGDVRMVINIAEVPMIDSSGIGLLVRWLTTTKQRGGSLKLVNPSKLALQTLKIVGLVNLFEIFNDEGEAVQSFG
jgi:anti-sigma B factor antagonist